MLELFLSISDKQMDLLALQDLRPLCVIVSVITDMNAMFPVGENSACKRKK